MTEQQREAFLALDQIEALAGWANSGEIEKWANVVRRALSHAEGEAVELDRYDAGSLGGDDDSPTCWWHDYIRSELDAAHSFYQQQIDGLTHPASQLSDMDHRVADLKEALQAVVDEDRDTPEAYLNRDHAKQVLARFGDPSALPEYSRGWNDAMEVKAAPQVAVPEEAISLVGDLATVLQALVNGGRIDQLDQARLPGRDIRVSEVLDRADALLAAAPTAPAGEPKHKPTPLHGPHGTIAYTADGHPASGSDQQPVSDPDGVIDRLRGQLQNCVNHLERAKNQAPGYRGETYRHCIERANAALYETLGYRAAPAPDEREIAAKAIEDFAERTGPGRAAWFTFELRQEAARLRSGKESEA